MHDLKRTDAPLVLYVHGQGGSAREAEHYRPLFPGKDVLGLDYQADTPWDFIREVRPQVQRLTEERGPLTLIANSIGAYFSMSALSNQSVQRAFFISPVVDMERLITDMMGWARITEGQLKEAGRIHTDFGQTLDWYLSDLRPGKPRAVGRAYRDFIRGPGQSDDPGDHRRLCPGPPCRTDHRVRRRTLVPYAGADGLFG